MNRWMNAYQIVKVIEKHTIKETETVWKVRRLLPYLGLTGFLTDEGKFEQKAEKFEG
jgi:hypothetical protein